MCVEGGCGSVPSCAHSIQFDLKSASNIQQQQNKCLKNAKTREKMNWSRRSFEECHANILPATTEHNNRRYHFSSFLTVSLLFKCRFVA